MSVELSVVLPAYQAAEFIGERLPVLAAHLERGGLTHEIVVVDDGSEDDTAERVEALALPRLRLLRRAPNRGKYAALKAGVAASTGRCCVVTDADVPYDLATVDTMAHHVLRRGLHVVIGDRTLPESVYAGEQTRLRRVLTACFSVLVRLFHTGGVADTQCGLKAFRGDVARALFARVHEERFAGDLELLYIALKHNLELKRVPVQLVYQGRSSVRPLRDGPQLCLALARMRWRYLSGRYRSEELTRLSRETWSPDGADDAPAPPG